MAEQENTLSPSQARLEQLLLNSLEEQRKVRYWRLAYKVLQLVVLLSIIIILARSCSHSSTDNTPLTTAEPHIGVIKIHGEIGGEGTSSSDNLVKSLKNAFEANNTKAIVLDINSPGGSPVQSDQVWQAIRNFEQKYPKKPVYAVIGDMGASGAYYIASAANYIYVNPSSLVGSIGVIMPRYDVEGLAQKLGVTDETMTSGEYKDILSMSRPMTDFEKTHVQNVLDDVHNHFIDAVKTGRGSRIDSSNQDLFSGLFWSGAQSVKNGLADKSGNTDTVMQELKLKAMVDYTEEPDPLQLMLGKVGASFGHALGSSMGPQIIKSMHESQSIK